MPTKIGDHLRRRRMDLGLIQKEVGQRIGVHCLSITNWELNKTTPELRYMPAIIAFLGYDPRTKAETLGERLVAFREARGWPQKRLAEALQVDPTTLSRWELGKKAPWGVYAERVGALLGG